MRATFTLLFFFAFFFSYAQSSFVKGYYVTHQNDTVQTFINDKNWKINPTFILVSKHEEGNDAIKLNILAVKSFKLLNGDWFERYLLPVDKSPGISDEIDVDVQPIFKIDTVFLRVLVKGELNLLYLKDEGSKEHFFIQRGNNLPQELIQKKTKQNIEGDIVLKFNRDYQTTLENYLVDCDQARNKIKNTRFGIKPLTNLILEYNLCKNVGSVEYIVNDEELKTKLNLIAGGFYTSVQYGGDDSGNLGKTNFTGSGYTAGASFEVKIPGRHNKWSFNNELLWKSYLAEGNYENYVSADNYTKTRGELGANSIGLNTMLRVTFNNKALLKPYLNIGIANNFAVSHTNKKKVQRRFYSDYPDKEEKVINDLRKYEQALLAGVGVNFKKINIEFRYERGNGMTRSILNTTTKNMIGIQVGYYLKD